MICIIIANAMCHLPSFSKNSSLKEIEIQAAKTWNYNAKKIKIKKNQVLKILL